MPRLRKLRRKQKYKYDVNRKRLNQRLNKMPDIKCETVRKAWDDKKSLNDNLSSMGLVADPNVFKNFKILSGKEVKKAEMLPARQEVDMEEAEPEKVHVVKELQHIAEEGFKAKKTSQYSLPPEMFKKLTKFLDKHGEDFEAMARDHMNYYQETAAQLRGQVNRLKKIPQQWIPYLRSRGISVADDDCLSNMIV